MNQKMTKVKTMNKLRALVVDYGGIYCETAVRFMRDCASVKYCTFSDSELAGKIGVGLDGVERVDNPWGHVDNVDFIFFPDTSSGEMVEYLKKHGYPVAGAGAVEKLEVDRWYGRQLQAKNGLPVQDTTKVVGVDNLKAFCKVKRNCFIKVDNEYRGVSESFKHYDFKSSEPRIDLIAAKTGPFKQDVIFICEELLEGSEPGFDGITFDGELLFPTMAGYEICKKSYIARSYKTEEELPDCYWTIHEGIKSEFKQNKTRFFYSDEMIVGKDKKPYLLDPTMRMASPGGIALQTEMIENFTEVCYGLATGHKVNPVIKFKYGIATPFQTSEAEKSFVNIRFPKKMRQWVKLIQACKKDGDYYSVPSEPIVCCVVALGNSIPETISLIKERMSEVGGNGLMGDESGLSKINEITNAGKLVGINF
jgi:phosphoribosylamine-glycine ligase